MKKILLFAVAALLFGTTFTSCNNENNGTEGDVWVALNFTFAGDLYNGNRYWIDTYNPDFGSWVIAPGVNFTHKAEVTEYDGVKYKSFTGFVPSIVNDQTDHTGQDWTEFQFGAIAPTAGQGYVIAHWDVRENQNTPLDQRSCLIDFYTTARPVSMTVTNTAYTYWTMKNGSPFSRPFDDDDFLALDIYGVHKDVPELYETIYLYRNGKYADTWLNVDLTGIGEVEKMFFTMRSSDSGEYGMNVPAYFAIKDMVLVYPASVFN